MNKESIQNDFLNHLKDERRQVTVVIVNGYQLKGLIVGHDQYIILLDSGGKTKLVYKSAVSTVIPGEG